jgi:hypothetical protein
VERWEIRLTLRVGVDEDEVLVPARDVSELGKIALQLPFALFGSEVTPFSLEWHWSLTARGIPASESSSAGSSKPSCAKPPSCGSSRKIAFGLGSCSDPYLFARFAVTIPPNEKPK